MSEALLRIHLSGGGRTASQGADHLYQVIHRRVGSFIRKPLVLRGYVPVHTAEEGIVVEQWRLPKEGLDPVEIRVLRKDGLEPVLEECPENAAIGVASLRVSLEKRLGHGGFAPVGNDLHTPFLKAFLPFPKPGTVGGLCAFTKSGKTGCSDILMKEVQPPPRTRSLSRHRSRGIGRPREAQ